MPHGDTPPAKTSAAARAARFSGWLVRIMNERGLNNRDLVKLMNRPGYDSAMVANWRKGRYLPSDLGAWVIADALALPAPDVMREAGYDEMAARIEKAAANGTAPPPRDPALEALDAVGDSTLTAPLAEEYERELAAARRRLDLELAELRRRLDADGNGTPPEEARQA